MAATTQRAGKGAALKRGRNSDALRPAPHPGRRSFDWSYALELLRAEVPPHIIASHLGVSTDAVYKACTKQTLLTNLRSAPGTTRCATCGRPLYMGAHAECHDLYGKRAVAA